jgi:tRNA dimethylallyltransferase
MPSSTDRGGKPLLIVAGPTGSGKSALALALALRLGGEIVNADSVQLYRGFDIGSAKTPAAARAGVPHHLLDVLPPDAVYTAGDWAQAASATIDGIWARGALPVLAGGTGFYVRTLLEGISESPARDERLRATLAAREAARPGLSVRALRRFDPATARRIHPNDSHKLLRALEICFLAGVPASQHFAAVPVRRLEDASPVRIVLDPPRAALHERIEQRTRRMFADGLLEETRALLAGGVPSSAKPFQSIGYKECLDVIAGRITVIQAIDLVTIATRQYAKRQLTWFRRDPMCFWINEFGDTEAALGQALSHVRARFYI